MASIWYLIVALMVTAYVILDGFDLGAGAIHLIAGKTDEERRESKNQTPHCRKGSIAADSAANNVT